MIVIDYTNKISLIVMILFLLGMGVTSFIKKKAWFVMTSVLVSIAMLVLHILAKDMLSREALKMNAMIDFVSLMINIPLLLIIDEIETRRSVIKNVFEKKYEKKK